MACIISQTTFCILLQNTVKGAFSVMMFFTQSSSLKNIYFYDVL